VTAGDTASASAAILLDGPRVVVSIAAGALAPMALHVAGTGRRLPRAALGAGLLAAASLWLPGAGGAGGAAAVALVAPYAIVCAIAGLLGARRLLARPWPPSPSRIATSAGLIALAGATTWLVAHRAGYALLGYPPLWVLLTAAHFHIAGAFLAIVLGWRVHGRGPWAGAIAIGCVAGVPLTAAGIFGPHALEVGAACFMAASTAAAACLLLATPSAEPAYRWLRLAGAPLLAGMVLAGSYALRDLGTAISIAGLDPLSSMIVTHGALDTLFAAIALGALVRRQPPTVR
jgi:YndJ-like protein